MPSTPKQTVSPTNLGCSLELNYFRFEPTYGLPSTPKPTVSPSPNFGYSEAHQILCLSSYTVWLALPSQPYPLPPQLGLSLSSAISDFELTYGLPSTPIQTVPPNFGCSEAHQILCLSSHTIWLALPSQTWIFDLTYYLHSTPLQTVSHKLDFISDLTSHTIWLALPSQPYPIPQLEFLLWLTNLCLSLHTI